MPPKRKSKRQATRLQRNNDEHESQSNDLANLNMADSQNSNHENPTSSRRPAANKRATTTAQKENAAAKKAKTNVRPASSVPTSNLENERSTFRFQEEGNEVEVEIHAQRGRDVDNAEYFSDSEDDEEEGEIDNVPMEMSTNNNATQRASAERSRSLSRKRGDQDQEGRARSAPREKLQQLEEFQKMLTKGECYVNTAGIIVEGPPPRVEQERRAPRELVAEKPRYERNDGRDDRHRWDDRGNELVPDQLEMNELQDIWDRAESVVTIYQGAVQPSSNKRGSSSSDELNNISDETIEDPNVTKLTAVIDVPTANNTENETITNPLGQRLIDMIKSNLSMIEIKNLVSQITIPDQPSTSDGRRGQNSHYGTMDRYRPRQDRNRPRELSPEEKAELVIKQAEAAKTHILEVPGRDEFNITVNSVASKGKDQYLQTLLVDEQFRVVTSHMDENTRKKFEGHEYVDFARLIARDRIIEEEDQSVKLVNKNGFLSLTSGSARSGSVINNYTKWEQAFHVFFDIYTARHPKKAAELNQYNYIIHTASNTYLWDNVYAYDRDFRIHMAKNQGMRSWAVILQLSWNLRLNDKLRTGYGGDVSSPSMNKGNYNKRDYCWRFNRGRCTYGRSCKFDHRCAICGKWGHGSHNCRKAAGQDKPQQGFSAERMDSRPNDKPNERKQPDRFHYYKDTKTEVMGKGGDHQGPPPARWRTSTK